MRVIIIAAMLLLIPFTAYGRLGETEEQCKRRYGKPIDSPSERAFPILEGAKNLTYEYKGWRLRIAFLNNKAVRIYYSKSAKAGISPYIQDDEAKAVLEGESGGGKWKETSKYSFDPVKSFGNMLKYLKFWNNTNGNVAYLQSGRLIVVVESPKAEAFTKARAEAKERKRKESIPQF
jgi:hypothetical protein